MQGEIVLFKRISVARVGLMVAKRKWMLCHVRGKTAPFKGSNPLRVFSEIMRRGKQTRRCGGTGIRYLKHSYSLN